MSTGTEVIKLNPLDQRWLSFISSHAEATIFHHPAWIGTLNQCYGYSPFILAICNPSGEICAGLPVMEVNHPLNNRRWVSLPFSDYCNVLYSTEDSLVRLAESLIPLYADNKISRVEFRWPFPEHPAIQMQSSYVLHTLCLDPDTKVVAKRASRQQMQNVRTAEKNEVKIVCGNSIKEARGFYRLHCLTRRKHGIPVQPWRFFELLTENLVQKGLGFFLLAYKDETCLVSGMFLHFGKTLTYKYSASIEEGLKLRPNHLLTWTAFQWGCENGFATFDFGRADLGDEGLSEYKRRWGADEIPLSYSYYPSAPKADRKSRFIPVMQTIIRKSPIWVTRLSGQLLYRYLG